MARAKLSEFKAKQLLSHTLKIPFFGQQIKSEKLDNISLAEQSSHSSQTKQPYVLKVDQGIKGRFKKGLVVVNKQLDELSNIINDWQNKRFTQFYLEPYIPHETSSEKYISIERIRSGLKVLYSPHGGINIEDNSQSIHEVILSYNSDNKLALEHISSTLDLPADALADLLVAFEDNYFSFLEINPLLVHDNTLNILDAAVEVDSTAEYFVNNAWSRKDFTDYSLQVKTPEEVAVSELAEHSTAAFNLTVLNPNGNLFMLLSGGGASIVLADEAYNQGYGEAIANYGENSGSPTTEEAYLYTKQLLSLIKKSTAVKKVLIIAGGVANFTDVRKTFAGVIQALEEEKTNLLQQQMKIFVRRGGPHQIEGLALMRDFLSQNNLLGEVDGPEMILTDVVNKALAYIKK